MYITKELESEKSQEIRTHREVDNTHCNPIGIIPKLHQPEKFRLIVKNLSAPEGASINDTIAMDLTSVQYTTVRRATRQVAALRRGASLAKLDQQSTERNVPVHYADQHLLGLKWKDKVYQEKALPFGLCLEPKIFAAEADALSWVLECGLM